MTKKDLQQYYWIIKNIERLEEKLFELEEKARKTTSVLQLAPGQSNNVDNLGDLVASMVDYQNKINELLAEAMKVAKRIEEAIAQLPERERYLVRARYIDCKSWEQIAVDMNYSWRQVHYIHSNALKLLASENFADHCIQLHTGT